LGVTVITLTMENSKTVSYARENSTVSWKKTGDNIKIEIVKILRSFDLYNIIDKVVFVTDRGSNIVAALRQFTRLSCSAQILNTVFETHSTERNWGRK
jgi:hypothetical protein